MTADPKLLTGLGAALSIFLSGTGSAIASAHSGTYAIRSQDTQGIKGLVPIVISGVLSIYGIIVSVILSSKFQNELLTPENGYRNLSAGLSVGLACWASGWGMAKFLKQCNEHGQSSTPVSSELTQPLVAAGVPASAKLVPPAPNAIFVMVMCFLEAIGLYGLIVALVLIGKD